MKMKKLVAMLACVALGATLFAGCGSSSSSSDSSAAADTTEEAAEETAEETTEEATEEAAADTTSAGGTIYYLSPSMGILYWQWVEDGVQQACDEAGYTLVTYDAENSTEAQATNAETAITAGAAGIVLSPVSSTSCPGVLDPAEEAGIPVAIAAIGTDEGVENYLYFASADDETSGYDAGTFLCERAAELGGDSIGVISLPMDRSNAQAKTRGLEKACEEQNITIAQTIQCADLTVSEADGLVRDLLTANPDIKGIYCMYEQAGTAAAAVLEDLGLEGTISIVSSDGSPESTALIREGKIDGQVLQEAVGQGLYAGQAVINYLENGGDILGHEVNETPEPLVTTDNIDDPESQAVLALTYPESAGAY